MAFDLKTWLTQDLGFSEAEVTSILPSLQSKSDALKKVYEGNLRQSDYDRKMNEGKGELLKLQTEFDAKNEALNKEIAEWATARAEGSGDEKKLRESVQKLQQDMFTLRQKATSFAEANGLDPKDILPPESNVNPNPNPNPNPSPIDPDLLKGFVKLSDLGALVNFQLGLPAELNAIAQEHQRLFGEPLDQRAIIAEIKTRAASKQPLDVQAIWTEKYGVTAKRQEVAKTEHDAEIKAAEDRGRQQAITESSLPTSQPQGRHAPVLIRPEGSKSHIERPQPGSRVGGAASALATHKYREAPAAGGGK